MELEKIIELAHKVAAPYKFCVWVLTVLLLLSMGANIYMFTNRGIDLDIYADRNVESEINQSAID